MVRVFWGINFMNAALLVGLYKKINVIYGGRTSLFLSSQRMPAATSSDCEMIQLYEYIIVDKMACAIFDYIFIYAPLVACCYNNEIYIFHFFIYLSLTVCCYNNEIKYAAWVA